MNCETILNDLYPYADHELGDSPAAEAVAHHVAACPHCAAAVREHGRVRAAVGRMIHATPVPVDLANRVRQALTADAAAPSPRIDSAKTRRRSILFSLKPMAIAASVVIGAGALWYSLAGGPGESRAAFPTALAQRVAAKHLICCENHARHHHADIPRDCLHAAQAIEEHFKGELSTLHAAAPDLSPRGFNFESVNFCGIRGPGCVSGGHILYVNSSGDSRFSVFSIPSALVPDRQEIDAHDDVAQPVRRCPPIITALEQDRRRLCIAMWHEGDSYYFCCGEVDRDRMETLVGDVAIALGSRATQDLFALLARGPAH